MSALASANLLLLWILLCCLLFRLYKIKPGKNKKINLLHAELYEET